MAAVPDDNVPADNEPDKNEPDVADTGSTDGTAAELTASGDEGKPSRSPAVIAVSAMLVAIATLGASAYMWRNPVTTESSTPGAAAPPAPETFTQEERDQARATVCDAFALVSVGVANSSGLQPPEGQANFGAAIAVAANARLALIGGGQLLLNRIEPATPDDLAEAARSFGNTLMDVGAAAIAEIPTDDPAQTQRLQDADTQNTRLDELCNPEAEPAPPAPPAG